jgi:preprotein translocase subunit YajC
MHWFETARAYAQAIPGVPGGGLSFLWPMMIIFAIFYFLLIRPQQKKQRQHQEMLGKLGKGEKIVTSGGVHGTIVSLDEATLTLQVDDKVRIKVSRSAVAGLSAADK